MGQRTHNHDRLLQFLRDEGPFAEQDLLALNAVAAVENSKDHYEAARRLSRERTALYRRLRWAKRLVANLQHESE